MRLETTGWYAAGIPLIGAVMGLEAWIGKRRGLALFRFEETISNLTAGLGTLLLGVTIGPAILALWDAAARHAIVDWHGSWLRWPFALVLSDLCYYLHHRAGHRFAALWAIHGVHHQHEHLNSTVGLRLEFLADVSTTFFFGLMPLFGIESSCGFAVIALLSLYTLTTHSPALARRSFGLFVTPATHGSHHSRDARYLDRNFGAMFAVWDRIFGTWREPAPGETLRDDLPSICRTHDGVSAQWSLLVELVRDLRATASLAAAWRILSGPPRIHPGPDRAPAPASARGPTLAAFLALLALAGPILWLRERLPAGVRLGGTIGVLAGLSLVGRTMDGPSVSEVESGPCERPSS